MKGRLKISRVSLKTRIFLSLIFLTLISSILIVLVSIYQFKKEAKYYHEGRLERRENSVKEHINYILSTTTYPLTTENLPLIFKDKIYDLSKIHKLEINIFDLDGHLLKSSQTSFFIDHIPSSISDSILTWVRFSPIKRYVDILETDGTKLRSSYSYIEDLKFKPLGILNLPDIKDDGFYDIELNNFLIRLGEVYIFMFALSILLAYFLSSYITQSLKIISEKIIKTRLTHKNEKIKVGKTTKEMKLLINAYNSMIDELEESATKLAQSQRELAWREMAKQVAHEIKNPLTPMRLIVQNFQRKFDINDPNIKTKIDEYSKILIQQIDTMDSIASAFSNFASMPAQQNEMLDIVQVVKLTLEIFNEEYIHFYSEEEEIITKMDRTQLIRIVTNLVKNAIQAIPDNQSHKIINVYVTKKDGSVMIIIEDNGLGIKPEDAILIFEPQFTTKNSGMGLGLGIIKNIIENYNGSIIFDSQMNEYTKFIVTLPIKIE